MANYTLNLEKMSNRILFGVLAVILLLANYLIFSKEYVLANGKIMLLELAPRDPRSILQGDYMVLRYRMAREIAQHSKILTGEGQVVVKLDDKNVAHYQRIYDVSTPPGDNEYLLFYRKRNGVVKIATDAFFFQEQQGKYYSAARYGEVHVSNNGTAVLTGLRDRDFNKLSAMPDEEM
ncbi:GDYXXLXY domain-containing protein [Kaarinaea lacus]